MKIESAVQFETDSRIHVSMGVQNLGRSVAFYSTLFGRGPTKTRPRYARFEVTEPPMNLHRPSVDFLFLSAAKFLGADAIGSHRWQAWYNLTTGPAYNRDGGVQFGGGWGANPTGGTFGTASGALRGIHTSNARLNQT